MSRASGLVVLFRPGPEVTANLAALRPQVDRLIVVDNASTPASRARCAAWTGDEGFELIANAANLGLAAALNQGFAAAARAGAEWVVTFDQDSTPPPGFVAALEAERDSLPAVGTVGLVAPVYRDQRLGFVYSADRRLDRDPRPRVEVTVAMMSGNLVRLAAARDAGGFREDFFIDCVDQEFCLRLRRRGWRIVETANCVLEHRQGAWTQRRLFGLRPRFNDYPAFRRYYQMRNRLVLYARHFLAEPRWIARDAWNYPREIVKLLLWGEDRGPKLRAMLRGVGDALLGRRGPFAGE